MADAAPPAGTLEHIRDPGERALHLKASRLPRVFSDSNRFGRTSVIAASSTQASLDILHDMRDAPLRKLLLAPSADDAVAKQALHEGLVDAVQDGHPAQSDTALTDLLLKMQMDFFRNLTSPIEPVLARADTRFLQDPAVRAAFADFATEHAIIEHCACMHPPGILGLDVAGNAALMIVVDDDYRQASFEIAHAEGAPTELLRQLAHGDTLAVFPTANGFYAADLAVNWRDCLWPGRKLGDNGWTSAVIDEPEATRIVCGSIASYDSYRRRRLS